MSPDMVNALFAGLNMMVAGIAVWLGQKARKQSERNSQIEQAQKEAKEHADEKFDKVMDKLSEQGEQIENLCTEVRALTTRVAIHDDRFDRTARLSVVEDR